MMAMSLSSKMRIVCVLPLLCALWAAGCSKLGIGDSGGSPTAPSELPPLGSSLIYSAVGASDVLGIGSSSPCFLFEDCNGTGYVWVAARQLRAQGYTVTVGNLGIPTATISRSFQDLGAQNGRTIAGNLIEQEMPFVSRNANVDDGVHGRQRRQHHHGRAGERRRRQRSEWLHRSEGRDLRERLPRRL